MAVKRQPERAGTNSNAGSAPLASSAAPAPANGRPARSSSYTLPVEDTAFLLRDELRGVRFALEYEKAELTLRDAGTARRWWS